MTKTGLGNVAVIGAGPGGLAAARWLTSEGFEPVIFERSDKLGGQWSLHPASSGIWDGMRTNTSRITTAFSDLDHPAETATYPTNRQVQDYLVKYAERFGLAPRFGTVVKAIRRSPASEGNRPESTWVVESVDAAGQSRVESFEKVIVASGRCNFPVIPKVPGMESFTGSEGVSHSFDYNPRRFWGKTVVVAGGAVSALEVAADMAMSGAKRVIVTQRRQRYVLQKMLAGKPSDHVVYNRFAALTQEVVPQHVVMQGLKDFVVRSCGSPEQFGAPKPAETLEEAGVSLSQYYLPLVAEGKIEVHPWMTNVNGNRVCFGDQDETANDSIHADAIIFATGFGLHLPFLDKDTRRITDLDATHIDLHKYTFHPDLPGLAFLGLYELLGPYFPVLELQARWIAYAFSGTCAMPTVEEQQSGLDFYRAHRDESQRVPVHFLAKILAQSAGVEAQVERHPELARALLFGPLSSVSYRLDGPDALADAPERITRAAAAFGVVPSPQLATEQKAMLTALAEARGDPGLAAIVSTAK